MPLARDKCASRFRTRLCPGCGYCGEELQRRGEEAVFVCPLCEADLYARPARSYAEMEGFGSDEVPPVRRAAPRHTATSPVTTSRWLKRIVLRLLRRRAFAS